MKFLSILFLVLPLLGCLTSTKSCDRKILTRVIESKNLEVNKIIKLKNIKNILFKSFREPTLVIGLINNNIFLEGIEKASIAGYQTDQCTAKEMKKDMQNAKPTVGYAIEMRGDTLMVKTTGERRQIHHQNAFFSIKVTLPKNITFKYEHLPLVIGYQKHKK